MFNVVPRMNCVTYWLVTCIRTKRKDRPFIFMLKFLTIFSHNFSQFFTIDNWKSAKNTLFDVPEHTRYSLLEDSEHSGYSLFECRSARGTHITLSGFPECSGHSKKSAWSTPGPQKKSARCSRGHQIMTFLLILNCWL